MRIRSITCFVHPRWPISELVLQKAGLFGQQARSTFEAAGYDVQTVRLATPPFHEYIFPEDYVRSVAQMEFMAHSEGFDYVSLGPASAEQLSDYAPIPTMLANSGNIFLTANLTTATGALCLPAIKACAQIIHQTAKLEKDGFANLRFAALANVGPWAPFFPAAYHRGKSPAFGLALEAADLAVSAFQEAASLAEARERLIERIEAEARSLEACGQKLANTYGFEFKGIDFTLAPFPQDASSIGHALELLGLPAFGLSGSLAAAAFITDSLDRASFQRTGFNGLMLPLLEDSTLAQRGAEGVLSIQDLLMYASVCGTGLDTIPLPGEIQVGQLQAILLDVAALSSRLRKPLTARLMPVPGKKAGDQTDFDFEFFANSRVLDVSALPLTGLLAGEENIMIQPRSGGS